MNEPSPQTSEQAGENGLWEKAPAWRNLTIAATLLTAVAAALPLALPPQTRFPAPVKPASAKITPVMVSSAPHISALPPPAIQPAQAQAHFAMLQPKPLQEPAPSQPAPQPNCPLTMDKAPRHLGTATVVGFIDHQQSVQTFQKNGARFGAPVNPAFLDYVRLLIHPDNAPDGITRGTLAPANLHVATGDRIAFDSAFRDPGAPCMWIPTMITADLGPARTPPPAQQVEQP